MRETSPCQRNNARIPAFGRQLFPLSDLDGGKFPWPRIPDEQDGSPACQEQQQARTRDRCSKHLALTPRPPRGVQPERKRERLQTFPLFFGAIHISEEASDENALLQIDATTARLQTDLWSTVRTPAGAQPTPVLALAVSGMNDVLNSQGYTQAAWWNRIPPGAWFLMAAVAICSNVLIGYDSHRAEVRTIRLLILPLVLSSCGEDFEDATRRTHQRMRRDYGAERQARTNRASE